VYAVTERRASEDYVQLNTLLPAALDEIEAISKGIGIEGVKSGFRDLDLLTHGFHPGNMIIIAARPAVGKSTLGLDIARHAAIHENQTAVIFSLEMSKSEITMRMLSAEARVGLNNIRSGQLSDDEWAKLARRMGEISDAPLFIDDSPNLSMMEIRAKARRLKQRHDLKLIVIDYLQLMSSGKRVENRQQEVSEFSRHLKLMAKELNVPVIAISQLNRSPEQRSDKKPMLSDLRESGSIEQDADVVILLHRDDMYDSQNRSGEADFIVAKHRNGPTRTITVSAQLHFARFFDMAPSVGTGRDFTQSTNADTQPSSPGDGGWNE
jgi:replicative DNA helicase